MCRPWAPRPYGVPSISKRPGVAPSPPRVVPRGSRARAWEVTPSPAPLWRGRSAAPRWGGRCPLLGLFPGPRLEPGAPLGVARGEKVLGGDPLGRCGKGVLVHTPYCHFGSSRFGTLLPEDQFFIALDGLSVGAVRPAFHYNCRAAWVARLGCSRPVVLLCTVLLPSGH